MPHTTNPYLNQNAYSGSADVNRSKISARDSEYVDLDLGLVPNPFTNDISMLRDERAIKNAVRNLLLTNFFERPFAPLLGANLTALLFEPADEITKSRLRESIARVLAKHEPRISLTNIAIIDEADSNLYNITIQFNIEEINTQTDVSVQLKRLR